METRASFDEAIKQAIENARRVRKECSLRKTIGERFVVPRMNKDGVQTILYRPRKDYGSFKLPVFFNMHGGAWIGGDAVYMESFCQMISDEVPAFVVNINYTKADEKPIFYAIEEVADTVKYFAVHAEEYNIDPNKMAVGGCSAGAQLAAGTAIKLKEDGVKLTCQVLIYPCTDLTLGPHVPENLRNLLKLMVNYFFPNGGNEHRYISPLQAKDEELSGLSPAIFVICGRDELKPMGIAYAKRLIDVGVPVKIKEYPNALHGFLEVNRPDFPPGDERQNPEQEAYCRDCERYLVQELRACFAEVS